MASPGPAREYLWDPKADWKKELYTIGRRTMKLEWAQALLDKAHTEGAKYFFKQVTAPRSERGADALGRIWHEMPDPPHSVWGGELQNARAEPGRFMDLLKCAAEGNKKIFLTKDSADVVANEINHRHGGRQHSYQCPHDKSHWHLTTQPIEGAPTLAQRPWPEPPPKPKRVEESKTSRVIQALKKHNGTRTAREVATELNVSYAIVVYAVKAHNLPIKAQNKWGSKKAPSVLQLGHIATIPAIQTERDRLLAALKTVEIKEVQLKKEEAERRSVKLQISSTIHAKGKVLLTAGRKHIQLSPEQCQDLLSKLPEFLEENFKQDAMKTAS